VKEDDDHDGDVEAKKGMGEDGGWTMEEQCRCDEVRSYVVERSMGRTGSIDRIGGRDPSVTKPTMK